VIVKPVLLRRTGFTFQDQPLTHAVALRALLPRYVVVATLLAFGIHTYGRRDYGW